jgi:hypothetical protein
MAALMAALAHSKSTRGVANRGTVLVTKDRDPEKASPPSRFLQPLLGDRPVRVYFGPRLAGKTVQSWSDEEAKRYESGNGIAWEAEHRDAPAVRGPWLGAAESERLARLDGDSPHLNPTDGLERRSNYVVWPDRHAAAHDQQVRELDRRPDGFENGLERIRHDPKVDTVRAGGAAHRKQTGPVCVGDARLAESEPRTPQFVAGREHGYHRLSMNR